ncbi:MULTISPECIES: lysis protein [Vibrio harveyi group]|uniref:lysis protein n=1 Tax=Vibrio harveyi group TaxID=717610 RepID=UPI00148DBE77|nr:MULTISPECIES: lysis protein [Vibrio harveyi group]MBE4142027.1 lysis protein [Vibrio parahaemolyticus]MCG6443661.1 lysis protein [Vibrio parahaemolyticus]MCG6451660.1 lysis protein [Vibrio parahaemolyticus]MCG6455949.1 lysis protein [Vibrio parahaemolyticus]NOH89193.1 lysis protein [Vibrio alginolyticus]
MPNAKLTVWATAIAVVVVATLSAALFVESSRADIAESQLTLVKSEIQGYIAALHQQRVQIQSFNQLGEKHAAELFAAKEEIDRLSDSLSTGPKRVYVQADCPAVPEATSTRSMGNANTPRLGAAAEQDYLRLRRMMIENEQQTKYLQDYIRTQCLAEDQL